MFFFLFFFGLNAFYSKQPLLLIDFQNQSAMCGTHFKIGLSRSHPSQRGSAFMIHWKVTSSQHKKTKKSFARFRSLCKLTQTSGFLEGCKRIHNAEKPMQKTGQWCKAYTVHLIFFSVGCCLVFGVLYTPRGDKVTLIKTDEGWCSHVLIDPCCYFLITGSLLLYYRV